MRYKKVLPGNTSNSGITQSGTKVYIFGTSMEVLLHVFKTSIRGATTIKHLKHHVLASLVDGTPNIAVIHGGCNGLGYKKNEALSTDDIVNAILEIDKFSLMVLKILVYLV